MRRSVAGWVLLASLAVSPAVSAAPPPAASQQAPATADRATDVASPEQNFSRATAALRAKRYDEAILELEALADEGYLHADIAYDRGLAYALRAATPGAQPGDLGRAAAAFEEAKRMAPRDEESARSLDLVRAEVARRRSKEDKKDVIVRPSLDRVILTAFSPNVWAYFAMASSLLLGLGLVLWRAKKTGIVHVTGSVLSPIAFVATVTLAPIGYFSRRHADTTKSAVVVAPEITLKTDDGEKSDAPTIPEATLVEIGQRRDDDVLVRWGSYEGYAPARSVRVLALQ
ncbi:MAG: hypothetical protein U0271_08795 [Polyangiaceae bacterium]